MTVVVPSDVFALAEAAIDRARLEIERPVYLVLVLRENVGADGLGRFQVAAAAPIGGVVDVARTVILCCLRIRAQRPRQNRRRALTDHLVRRNALLNPVDEGSEVSAVPRPGPRGAKAEDRRAAVADAGRMEQAIEALHARKTVSVVVPLVALRHLSIVVENAARIDEVIVRAEESHHLSAECPEG